MKATIKGLQKVDYVSKKTGQPVDGVTFHIERENDEDVTGSACEQLFINSERLQNLGVAVPVAKFKETVGKKLEFEYNRFGMIAAMVIAP